VIARDLVIGKSLLPQITLTAADPQDQNLTTDKTLIGRINTGSRIWKSEYPRAKG
jgi:hypothetical protein